MQKTIKNLSEKTLRFEDDYFLPIENIISENDKELI